MIWRIKSTTLLLVPSFVLLLFATALPLHAQQTSKAALAKQLLQSATPASQQPDAADLAGMKVSSETYSTKSGVTHVYFQQHVGGIPVHNAMLDAHVTAGNELLVFHNRFVPGAHSNPPSATPTLTAAQAVEAAALALGYPFDGKLGVKETLGGTVQAMVFDKGNLSLEDIPVQLMWQPMPPEAGGGLRLAWDMSIYEIGAHNWWSLRIDAQTGELLDKNNWVVHCDFGEEHGEHEELGNLGIGQAASHPIPQFPNSPIPPPVVGGGSYRVYPGPLESPYKGPRQLEVDPADATASPFGWHDTNGVSGAEFTTTQGNNAFAYTDLNADNAPDPNSSPNGGVALQFDYPLDLTQGPSTYRFAAVTNLFYWNNYIHDFTHFYGFDETSGNFQQNNYGNGGLGEDYVNAEAQDGSGTNNANFGTPPDGSRPRMQMYIGTNISPNVDGDLDNGVIVHEYAHGISNRLTGGPGNTSCLGNQEQMGEGWSDYFAIMMTLQPTDSGPMARPMGNYLFGQPPSGNGIRPTPYSTDMSINTATYNTIKTVSVPHGVGYVWAGMLWDMSWLLMEAHGQATGYDEALNLVMEGMKLQPCSPGFVDGRNAILAADVALYGGANQCLIWQAFARRGLGFSALQGSTSSRSDGTQAFDLPPTLPCLSETPNSISVCNNDAGTITISANATITGGNLALSLVNAPVGVTATFVTNPLAPGASTDASIIVGPTVPQGVYPIIVKGTNGNGDFTVSFLLKVRGTPALTTLLAPANGAIGVYIEPTLSWDAVTYASQYRLQISLLQNFSTMFLDTTILNTTFRPSLTDNTTYYWRVAGINSPCIGAFTATQDFTTGCAANMAAPMLLSPTNGATDVSILPILDWSDVPNTITYTLEVATDAAFTNIISTVNGLTASQAAPSILLSATTQFFWRARANNLCLDPGNNSTVFSFTTNSTAIVCNSLASADVPVAIDEAQVVTVTSTITIPDCGTVTDINLLNLGITHTYVNDVVVELTSPEGTTVRVLNQPCGSQNNILINFDDEAINNYGTFPCPPVNNGTYKPFQTLTAFDGESLAGVWTLTIKDVFAEDGGTLDAWSLEYCYLPASGTLITCYQDADDDNFGNANISGTFCNSCPEGWTSNSTDCNDNNPAITVAAIVTCYQDLDVDGYGNAAVNNDFCGVCGIGYVSDSTDCNDYHPDVKPNATEVCDLEDNNCNGIVDDGFDADNDSYTTCGGDCNDNNAAINPGMAEACNNLDDDCNGFVDDYPMAATYASTDVPKTIVNVPVTVTSTLVLSGINGVISDLNLLNLDITHTYVADVTSIQLASPAGTVVQFWDQACGSQDNFLLNFDDEAINAYGSFPCPPTNNGTYQPYQSFAAFNGEDPNGTWTLTFVDGFNGDGGSINAWSLNISTPSSDTYYADMDGDNYGNAASSMVYGCALPGYTLDDTDCNDSNAAMHPGATEICDGLDNDCANGMDDGLTFLDYYLDGDGDTYGAGAPTNACQLPGNGYVLITGDCNDSNAAIYPGATEICDGLDNDCNGNPEAASNTWTGAGDGTNWSDVLNWSDGIVPMVCQDVVIPSGNVTVPAGVTAVGKTLDVVGGAILLVDPNGVLDIKND